MPAPLESSPELINELEFLLGNWDRLTDAEREFVVSCSKFLDRGYRVNKYMMAVRPNLYPKQQTFLGLTDLEVYTGGSGGGGKALSLTTALPTPCGFSTIGEIAAGDFVLGWDRKPKRVLATSEVMIGRPCYRLTFDDGTAVVADADHLWVVTDESTGATQTLATIQMLGRRWLIFDMLGNWWTVTGIQQVESDPVKCIAVDCPSHLYLVGESGIPTHNSDSLLLAALQFADVPTYSAVVFRSTFKNLNRSGSIMDRCRDWLRDSDAHWDGNDYRFTFPGGAKIGFAYLESLKHADQHRSAEYQAEMYDECTEISEECYRFLFSRLRRNKTGPNIPLRVRAASNPGGEHSAWVKSRFIPQEYLDCKDNDYRFSRAWEKSDPCGDCGGTGKLDDIECLYCDGLGKQVRVFLPSRVQDNPALDANEYRKSLSRMTWIERMQVEHGDWDITAEGGVFRMAWLRYYAVQGDYLRLTRFDEHNRPLPDVIVSRREAMIFVTADTATKAKTSADYSVISTWLFHRQTGSLALLDVIRKKVDTPDLLPLLSGACLQAKAKFVLIEEASSGTELIQLLRKNNACIGGIPVKSYLTGSLDKVARSAPAQLRMESGMIYFPAFETAWKAECVAELLSFPKSINDDFVDNVSMAAWYAENHNSIHVGGNNASNLPSEIGSGPQLSYTRSSLDEY